MPSALDTSYEVARPCLDRLVGAFCRRHPGADYHELRAEADWSFVKACRSHRPDQGTFAMWLTQRLWHDLTDHWRRPRRSYPHDPVDLDQKPARCPFQLQGWLNELSEDAQLLARAALELPRNQNRHCHRRVLRGYLQKLGWSLARIAESFQEISEALR